MKEKYHSFCIKRYKVQCSWNVIQMQFTWIYMQLFEEVVYAVRQENTSSAWCTIGPHYSLHIACETLLNTAGSVRKNVWQHSRACSVGFLSKPIEASASVLGLVWHCEHRCDKTSTVTSSYIRRSGSHMSSDVAALSTMWTWNVGHHYLWVSRRMRVQTAMSYLSVEFLGSAFL